MRFIKISRRLQLRSVAAVASLLALWLTGTIAMVGMQIAVAQDRIALSEKQRAVAMAANKVAAFRDNVDEIADDLERRQGMLDAMVTRYFGGLPEPAKPGEAKSTTGPTAMLPAEAAPLASIGDRQRAFAAMLNRAASERADQAEAAIRKFGINPKVLAQRSGRGGQGGPYLPARSATINDPTLRQLAATLDRLDRLERSLLALPSDVPTTPVLLNSGFGYRADPFTRATAMHAGLDFDGTMGQPIYAAADGVVVSAGPQGGYGNAIDIAHGNGLMTRYGHLSKIAVRPGQKVTRGTRIGGMGSTGRSTGTHLHFEVRMNGQAVNPRPFLEAASDVLEIKNRIRRRIDGSTNRG